MDSSKLGVGEAVAGIGGLALFVFMFLPWYGGEVVGFGLAGGDVNAWQAFSLIDLVLFLVCVVVVGLVLVQMAETTPELPAPPARIIAIAGVVALLLILFRMIVTPDVGGGVGGGFEVETELGRKVGVFLGLIAAGAIAYGGWRAASERGPGAVVQP